MSIPRRHHLIPQVLLRPFAERSDRIKVVSTANGKSRISKIVNVSVERDANTLQTSSGPDFELELLLSKIENEFARILNLLDLRSRSPEQTSHILAMVATQAARMPFTRSSLFASQVEQIYKALRYALLADDPQMSAAAVEGEVDHYGRMHIVQPHVVPSPRNVAIAGTISLIDGMYEDLAPYRLSVLQSSREQFVTADNPASVFPETVAEDEQQFFLADTEFVMPLTPKHAVLITSDHALPQWIDVSLSVEHAINARTAKAALREIYCAPSYPAELASQHIQGWWRFLPLIGNLS